MQALKIKQDLFWTGVLDPELKVFDIIMETKYGTSYNSYLLKGSEKTALFETSKLAFWEEMKSYIESEIPITEIDYLIMDHTEPDHAGTVVKLIEANPSLTVVGTGTAIQFLQHIVNTDFNSLVVKEGDTLSLGDKTLKFLVVPNLHWPDSMYTYVPEIKTLFTCDSFGSHYACQDVLRSRVPNEENYREATKYYFDCILGPFRRPFMANALKRVKALDVETICCGHGPVLDSRLDEIFGWYEEWCAAPAKRDRKLIVMPYVSAYGYTKQLAEEIARGAEDAGEIEVHRYDLVFSDKTHLASDMAEADAYLFGTPTILGEALEPIWELTLGMFAPVHRGRLASAFGAYGWSGEGVPHIIERLKQIRLNVVDGFRVRFKPDSSQLADAYDFGYNFGCTLLKKPLKQKTGPRTLVKCLVCGAIFDSSLEVCPVCGVGKDNFVPDDGDANAISNNTNLKYLILGGGIAGLEAAKAIRARDKTGGITILSEENHLPYNRPMLTKALLSDLTEEQMLVEQQSWFDENSISFVKNVRITAIDTAEKTVICGDNMKLVYDRLIYALGARSFIPPVPGADQDHVFAVRTLEDAANIRARIKNVKHAAVIGGGVLGLEAAWSLARAKVDVTVLEFAPKIMMRQLHPDASDMLTAIAEANGVHILTGVETAEIRADSLVLKDGREIPADLVIMSTGVRGNVDIAKEAGIAVDRSIVVNDRMETNIPDIYAAGDCAQYNGINYALWSQSVDQGKVAGGNAAGDDLSYETVDGALSFNGMNTSLFSIGDHGTNPEKSFRTVEIRDPKRNIYERYTFENNRLVGVILIGDTSKLAKLTTKVKEHAAFKDVVTL
ncbi:MAG: FAD-dependent oxidoreductase [Lachnospiraceae bacterium]|nr:FAD-dependent oxidoreductase [Lachnospiraceae bacterium]